MVWKEEVLYLFRILYFDESFEVKPYSICIDLLTALASTAPMVLTAELVASVCQLPLHL